LNIETGLGAKKSSKEMVFHEDNINWFYNKIKGLGFLEKMHLRKESCFESSKRKHLKTMVIETQP